MTKFDSEAIEQRGGRSKGNLPTQREQRKEMEKFLKTGRHPGRSLMAKEPTIVPLPERDPHRPHCFFEFRRGKHVLGEQTAVSSTSRLVPRNSVYAGCISAAWSVKQHWHFIFCQSRMRPGV